MGEWYDPGRAIGAPHGNRSGGTAYGQVNGRRHAPNAEEHGVTGLKAEWMAGMANRREQTMPDAAPRTCGTCRHLGKLADHGRPIDWCICDSLDLWRRVDDVDDPTECRHWEERP